MTRLHEGSGAVLVAVGLVLASAAVAGASERTNEKTYVSTGNAPSVFVCDGSSLAESNGNAGTACFDVLEGESTVSFELQDLGASTSVLARGLAAPCAHYTVYDADRNGLANGVFQGSSGPISLPADAAGLLVEIGESHGDGAAGVGYTDCPDATGTAGEIVATFN